ncbi:MAG: hypothetical protein ACK5CA_03845, partial [Cyanobacteriota bacterium]
MTIVQKIGLKFSLMAISALTLLPLLSSCAGQPSGESQSSIKLPFTETVRATGAGASFPAPLYQNWMVQLNQEVPQ